MVEFGKPKVAKQIKAIPKPGSFSPDKEELDWQSCREQFAKIFPDDLTGFYFSHEPEGGERVACFLSKIEDILELTERTEYAKTNLNFALWVAPAQFWKSCDMRKSLLTILLRSAIIYDPVLDNFEAALYSDGYAAETKDAIQRFLFGFTSFVSQGDTYYRYGLICCAIGWRDFFVRKPIEFIRSRLVLPDGKEQDTLLMGNGSLWQ